MDIVTPNFHGSMYYMDTVGKKKKSLFIIFMSYSSRKAVEVLKIPIFFFNFKECHVEISAHMTSTC